MTTDERLDRLSGVLDALPTTVVAHDNQIEGIIKAGDKLAVEIEDLMAQAASSERRWQAYLNTLPRQ